MEIDALAARLLAAVAKLGDKGGTAALMRTGSTGDLGDLGDPRARFLRGTQQLREIVEALEAARSADSLKPSFNKNDPRLSVIGEDNEKTDGQRDGTRLSLDHRLSMIGEGDDDDDDDDEPEETRRMSLDMQLDDWREDEKEEREEEPRRVSLDMRLDDWEEDVDVRDVPAPTIATKCVNWAEAAAAGRQRGISLDRRLSWQEGHDSDEDVAGAAGRQRGISLDRRLSLQETETEED
eukprot:2911231-Prymnesium_polylepis.1